MSRVSDTPHFVYVLWRETGRRFYIGISQTRKCERSSTTRAASKVGASDIVLGRSSSNEEHPDYTSARKREIELKAQKGGRDFFAKTGLDPSRFGRQQSRQARSVVQIHP